MSEEQLMPCWYYEKEDLKRTPSITGGMEYATEQRYRTEGARFIIDCGNKLGLRFDTCASGVVFFQRFYMFHSFKDFPRYVTAACCLFLAGKVEETPKKCRDIVRTARSMLNDNQFMQFGSDPREEVMTMERILLKTIKFDLQVSHPYKYLLQYVKKMKGDKAKLEQLVQMSWTFINDSLCTTLSLQWEPEVVACAVLYLATRLSKQEILDWEGRVNGQRWWECFVEGMSIEVMEDICHQILDLYSESQPAGGKLPGQTAPATSRPTTSATSIPVMGKKINTLTSTTSSAPTSMSTTAGTSTGAEIVQQQQQPPITTHQIPGTLPAAGVTLPPPAAAYGAPGYDPYQQRNPAYPASHMPYGGAGFYQRGPYHQPQASGWYNPTLPFTGPGMMPPPPPHNMAQQQVAQQGPTGLPVVRITGR